MDEWFGCSALLAVVLILPTFPSKSDASQDQEVVKLKAAFVYNFVKYVQWPDDAFEDQDSPIVIGVAGSDAMHHTLDATVSDKRVGDRPLQVVPLRTPSSDPDDAKAYKAQLADFARQMARCHVVYFGPDERQWVGDLYEQAGLPDDTLTVGDGRAYLDVPTMLDLAMDKGRVVFYANLQSIERARLKISSKLLRLARKPD